MRPAFGVEAETTTATPAKKRATKTGKAAKKRTASKKGDGDTSKSAEVITEDVTFQGTDTPPAKRVRRTPEQMAADGAKSRTRTPAAAFSGDNKDIIKIRREAERLTAKADKMESQEILKTARNHMKELERETITLGRAMQTNSAALDRARKILMKLEGPGE